MFNGVAAGEHGPESPGITRRSFLTFDELATSYLEDYALQRYRSMSTARPRVGHLRELFGGQPVDAITADAVRQYQLHRRQQGAESATINRETSALSRMFHIAIRRDLLKRMPIFPNRLEENPPRQGFFEHDEYLKIRSLFSMKLRPLLLEQQDMRGLPRNWRARRDSNAGPPA